MEKAGELPGTTPGTGLHEHPFVMEKMYPGTSRKSSIPRTEEIWYVLDARRRNRYDPPHDCTVDINIRQKARRPDSPSGQRAF